MKGDAVNVARMVLFTEKKCAILVILASKMGKLYDLVKLSRFEDKFPLAYNMCGAVIVFHKMRSLK